MNRPVVGYNRLCVDARPFDDAPPMVLPARKIQANFAALRFGLLPEISRFTLPEKRAKLTSTSGLFRRQRRQNSKLNAPDCNQNNGNRRSQRSQRGSRVTAPFNALCGLCVLLFQVGKFGLNRGATETRSGKINKKPGRQERQ